MFLDECPAFFPTMAFKTRAHVRVSGVITSLIQCTKTLVSFQTPIVRA